MAGCSGQAFSNWHFSSLLSGREVRLYSKVWDKGPKGEIKGSPSFGPKLAKREFGKGEKLYQAPTL